MRVLLAALLALLLSRSPPRRADGLLADDALALTAAHVRSGRRASGLGSPRFRCSAIDDGVPGWSVSKDGRIVRPDRLDLGNRRFGRLFRPAARRSGGHHARRPHQRRAAGRATTNRS